MMLKALSLCIAIVAILAALPSAARADCAPYGVEGEIVYNSVHNVVQFCDGSQWWAMKSEGLPACVEGETIVKTATGWDCGAAGGGGLSGPSGCANIGDLCADGTVFAGYHPITQEHLFIPTADQERPGSPGTFTMSWKNATGTNDISTDSTNDGVVNHANRGGAIGNFQAFQACEDLTFGGQTDWYLPSQIEIYYIWTVHETIEATGNITNFQDAIYWSSSEYNTTDAWHHVFTNGGQYTDHKNGTFMRVRCIRR